MNEHIGSIFSRRCYIYSRFCTFYFISEGWVGLFLEFTSLNIISVISRLESRGYPISDFVLARSGFESRTPCSTNQELNHYATLFPVRKVKNTLSQPSNETEKRSSGGRVVKLLACSSRGPGFDSRPRHLNFQRLVISCFKVGIWLKDR